MHWEFRGEGQGGLCEQERLPLKSPCAGLQSDARRRAFQVEGTAEAKAWRKEWIDHGRKFCPWHKQMATLDYSFSASKP